MGKIYGQLMNTQMVIQQQTAFVLPAEFQYHIPYSVDLFYRYLLTDSVGWSEFSLIINEMHSWLETNLGEDRKLYYKWSTGNADEFTYLGCTYHSNVSFIHAEDSLAFKLKFGEYL